MAVKISVYGTANMKQIDGARKELDRLERQAAASSKGFNASMTRISNSMKNAGDNVTKAGRTMTRNVTLPILGIGIASAIAFDKVDSALDTVAARSGKTGAELAQLGDTFESVAEDAVQDMETIGEVVGRVGGKFGLTGKYAKQLATQVLDLSRVAGTDAVTTFDAVGTYIDAFGINAKKAGPYLDALLAAAQKANIGVDSLATTAAKAAPTFKTYGLNAKESVALIASMEGAGIPATRVVAGLNSAFKKFTEAGIKNVPKALKEVLTNLRDMKDPTKATAAAVDLFGSRVGVTLAEAVRSGKVDIDNLTGSLDKSKGALDRAKEAVEGPQEVFARLKNQLLLAGAALMEAVMPALEMIVPYIKQAVEWFKGLDDTQRKVIVVVGLLAAAIGPLLLVFGTLLTVGGAVAGAIAGISLPIVAVVAGIAVFVAAVVLLWTKSQAFRDGVMKVWETVKAAVLDAINNVKAKFDEHREQLDKLKAAIGKVWEFVQDKVFPIIAEFYSLYLKTLITVIGFLIGKVIDVISWFVDFAGELGKVARKIAEFVVGAKMKLTDFVTAVREKIAAVIGFVQSIPDRIKQFFADAATWLIDAGKAIVEGLKKGVSEAWDSFTGWFSDKVGSVTGVVSDVLGINSPARVMIPLGEAMPEGLEVGVKKGMPRLISAVQKMGTAAASKAKEAIEASVDKWGEVIDRKQAKLTRLQDFFTRLRDVVVSAFAQMKDRAQEKIDQISNDLANLVNDAKAYSKAIADSLAVAFEVPGIEAAQDKVTAAQEAMGAAVTEFGKDSEEAKRAVKDLTDAQKELAKVQAGGGVLERFRQGIKDAGAFVDQIRQLRDFGLNETSLQNIIREGVENGRQIAASLLSGGSGAIGEVNALQAAFTDQVTQLGDLLSADKFGEQIAQAEAALVQAQASYAAIAAREIAQLAQIDALAKKFGIETDAMTEILNAGEERITALLANEDTATTLLADAVGSVTTGLIQTAGKLAKQAATLQQDIASLEARVAAAQGALNTLGATTPDKGGSGGTGSGSKPANEGTEWTSLLDKGRSLTGGKSVTIAEGAVQVTVGSEAQVGETAEAVDQAMRQLARVLVRS